MPEWTIPNKFSSSVKGVRQMMVPCPLRTEYLSIFDPEFDPTIDRVLFDDHCLAVLN